MNVYYIITIIIFIILLLYRKEIDNYIPSIGMSYIQKNDTFKYININRKNKEKSIAVVTTLINYKKSVVYSFVKSLDNVKFKGHIILFLGERLNFNFSNPIIHQILVNNIYPYYSLENNEFPIPIEKLLKYIPNKCHWVTIRYYIYSIWLNYFYSQFKYFYFCDGRDIIFQLNPSMWNFDKGVHLTLESDSVKIRNSKWNIGWTKEFKMGYSIFDKYPINGGTIFGSSKEVKLFISQMIYMLKYINISCANDQGTLTYFYYSHPQFTYPAYLNSQGYGYTLSLTDLNCKSVKSKYCYYKIMINDSKIKNLDGSIPIILHGLERWKNTYNPKRKNEYFYFVNKYYTYYSAK